jgi:threonine dehydrogenase-like Zn-dependent dehydrogenase
LIGASSAVLLERSAVAIDIATRQGIGAAIDTSETSTENTLATLRKMAPEGFGSVFDTVGTPDSLDLALSALGKTGTLVNLAIHDAEIPLNFLRLGSERKIVSSCNFEVGDYPKALAWLESGRLKVREWMTPTTLPELPSQFDRITSDSGEKGVFKLVIDPWK